MERAVRKIFADNGHRPIFISWLRKTHNEMSMLPSSTITTGTDCGRGEKAPLPKPRAIISLLVALNADYVQKELAEDLGVKPGDIASWIMKDQIIEKKAGDLVTEYADGLLKKIIAILKKTDSQESDAQQIKELLEEAYWLSGPMLAYFCDELILYIDGKRDSAITDKMIQLAEIFVLKALPTYPADCRAIHQLSRKILGKAFNRDFSALKKAIEQDRKEEALKTLETFSQWVLSGFGGTSTGK